MAARRQRVAQLEIFAREIQERFETSKYWEYEKFLGNGSYGVTVLLRETNLFVVRQKRIALKLARRGAAAGIQQLRTELRYLKRLRGAKHIVRMVASCDNLNSFRTAEQQRNDATASPIKRIVESFGKLLRLSPTTAFGPLEGLMQGPAIALEYLDKGDLVRLKENMDVAQEILPNRVLWSLFLCLIRACIGMAYPLGRPEGTPSVLETIPADGTRPGAICHNDIAARNVMIASGDGLDEHGINHLFKLIDFGSAQVYGPPRGPPENLFDCAKVMFYLMSTDQIPLFPTVFKGEITRAGSILPDEDNPNDDPYSQIDLDLRDLVARCMYADSSKRPTLQQALDEALAALNKDLEDFPDAYEETDDNIRGVFQDYIFDVPDNNFR
ncbi:kinase-like protein [Xylaria longipes]|nr:kinase-like protein [Xylaria longipes]